MSFKTRHPKLFIVLTVIVVLIVIKAVWTWCFCSRNGTFDGEKKDILERRAYLIEKVITTPEELLGEMPSAIGPQFQGEWALYTCSMLSAALVSISNLYPETREESVEYIDSLINIVLSPEIRQYDMERWGEDPLESLEGDNSHISYLSHLAWMICGYKYIGGERKYDSLLHSLCRTMDRRILQSENLNLETYPGEYVYIPDMLVAIVALENYSRIYNGKYSSTVSRWLDMANSEWLDEKTGLLPAFLSDAWLNPPVKGSYSALSCYYLTFIDEDFAREQYDRFKETFLKRFPVAGFKEYSNRGCLIGFDIDAGPLIFNLSPSGTAFGVGSVTYFNDVKIRRKLLRTAETAGTTVSCSGKRHYLLADIALVGEAIMLAMRTNTQMQMYPL